MPVSLKWPWQNRPGRPKVAAKSSALALSEASTKSYTSFTGSTSTGRTLSDDDSPYSSRRKSDHNADTKSRTTISSFIPISFNSRLSVASHISLEPPSTVSSNALCCTVCQMRFARPQLLHEHRLHYSHHHAKSPKSVRFRCPVCERKATKRNTLLLHLRHYHADVQVFCCPHCDGLFHRGTALKAHVAAVHGDFCCYRCSFQADDSATLLGHYNDYHLKCRYCKQRFAFLWVHQQKCPAREFF